MNMLFFVVLSSAYITVQQRAILRKLRLVNSNLSCELGNRNLSVLFWSQYWKANTEVLHVCHTIKGHSRYWAPFLSIIFPYYVFVQVQQSFATIIIIINF